MSNPCLLSSCLLWRLKTQQMANSFTFLSNLFSFLQEEKPLLYVQRETRPGNQVWLPLKPHLSCHQSANTRRQRRPSKSKIDRLKERNKLDHFLAKTNKWVTSVSGEQRKGSSNNFTKRLKFEEMKIWKKEKWKFEKGLKKRESIDRMVKVKYF